MAPAHQAAAELPADFEQLRAQLPTALVEVGWPSLRVLYINAIGQTLLGYSSADVACGIDGLSLLDAPSQREVQLLAAEQLAETVAHGLPYKRLKGQRLYELTGVRKDGSQFPAEVQAAWVLDRDGFPMGIRFIFRDLSERRMREQERRYLELQARQAQKLESLGALAGGIAHHFNNLLTATLGNLHMLATRVEDQPDALQLVREVEASGRRAAALVQRLLQFAEPEFERHEVVDLNALARETIALVEPSLLPGVKLELTQAAQSADVLGDSQALQHVLVNLLMNARDVTTDGDTIRLSVSHTLLSRRHGAVVPHLAPGAYVTVEVTDSGPGIESDLQQRIFDPFFSTKDPANGSGLGLSVSLGIARSHKGWITVESLPGHGATLRVLLPIAASTSEAAPPALP